MSIDTLAKKEFKRLAEERFSIGSIVRFRYPMQDSYGKVQKITKSGRIYVIAGEIEQVEFELKGCYWHVQYDPEKFTPRPFCGDEEILRFMPHLIDDRLNWFGSQVTGNAVLLNIELKKGRARDQYLNY